MNTLYVHYMVGVLRDSDDFAEVFHLFTLYSTSVNSTSQGWPVLGDNMFSARGLYEVHSK